MIRLSVLLLGLAFVGCASSPDSAPIDDPMPEVEARPVAEVEVGGAGMTSARTLRANLSEADNLTVFMAAAEAAGLDERLAASDPITVFAPTDAAFAALPAGTVETLLQPENRDRLTALLNVHLVPGHLRSSDLRDGQVLTTLQGDELAVRKINGQIRVGSATIQIPNVPSSNGVAHVLDAVLMPAP